MIVEYIIYKIKSFLNRIRGKYITHIIITTNGKKIKCYDSVELFDEGENKILVVNCQINFKNKLMTIKDENISYITENFNGDAWNEILNMTVSEDKIINENRLYV